MRQLPTSKAGSVVVAALLSASCASTRYTQSAVVAVPTGVKGDPGSKASIEIEGLKLRVEALDRAPREQAIPSLTLRIVFDPRELGYSFDAGQVVLRSADGREWRALGGEYRPIYPKAGFTVAFDASVPKDASFDLVLGGLARGPRRLEPVTLRLARREGRSYDRLYWLEAIGYAVALPLIGAGGGM
ncbi:MAG TPA: hypothetical protein VLL75_17810 [Vicinamibacteria bacterium]|nr:hypothetical protein [Vicinamibacteria bacterium]